MIVLKSGTHPESIAIIDDQTIASRKFGSASLHPQKAVTAVTPFDIASSPKSLTAASVGLLGADNDRYPQVQWEAKMSRLLPDNFVISEKSCISNVPLIPTTAGSHA